MKVRAACTAYKGGGWGLHTLDADLLAHKWVRKHTGSQTSNEAYSCYMSPLTYDNLTQRYSLLGKVLIRKPTSEDPDPYQNVPDPDH
jgi:hypothetical protein